MGSVGTYVHETSLKLTLNSLKRTFDHHGSLYSGLTKFSTLSLSNMIHSDVLSQYASMLLQGHLIHMRKNTENGWRKRFARTFGILHHPCVGLVSMNFAQWSTCFHFFLGFEPSIVTSEDIDLVVVSVVYSEDSFGFSYVVFDAAQNVLQCEVGGKSMVEDELIVNVQSLESKDAERLAFADWIGAFIDPSNGFAHFKCPITVDDLSHRACLLPMQLEQSLNCAADKSELGILKKKTNILLGIQATLRTKVTDSDTKLADFETRLSVSQNQLQKVQSEYSDLDNKTFSFVSSNNLISAWVEHSGCAITIYDDKGRINALVQECRAIRDQCRSTVCDMNKTVQQAGEKFNTRMAEQESATQRLRLEVADLRTELQRTVQEHTHLKVQSDARLTAISSSLTLEVQKLEYKVDELKLVLGKETRKSKNVGMELQAKIKQQKQTSQLYAQLRTEKSTLTEENVTLTRRISDLEDTLKDYNKFVQANACLSSRVAALEEENKILNAKIKTMAPVFNEVAEDTPGKLQQREKLPNMMATFNELSDCIQYTGSHRTTCMFSLLCYQALIQYGRGFAVYIAQTPIAPFVMRRYFACKIDQFEAAHELAFLTYVHDPSISVNGMTWKQHQSLLRRGDTSAADVDAKLRKKFAISQEMLKEHLMARFG